MIAIAETPSVQGFVPSAGFIESAFNAGEVDQIEAQCASLKPEPAQVVSGTVLPGQRNANVAWITNDAGFGWFYLRMHAYLQQFNTIFGFNLSGFQEPMQHLDYGEGGRYGWHVDADRRAVPRRKLSFSLQLSEPEAYSGGDLQVWGTDREIMPRGRGTLICFPSFVLHQVTPITRGTRRSIVAWASGEPFR